MRFPRTSAALAFLAGSVMSAADQTPLRAVAFTDVKIKDEFWAPRLKTVLEATLPHCFKECEQTGRIGNFDKAAGKLAGGFEGRCYNDSDVYKVIEGAAYALMHARDARLEAYVDDLIARIGSAQQPDGYLNTFYTLKPDQERWSDIGSKHELYCAGHLLEAAIAYHQATGKRALLDVALRSVDHIAGTFGPGKRHDPPGHQELELALMKLYRLTGESRYADLARFFVEQRGRPIARKLYGEYSQDHAPLADQTQIVGHAVRGMYYLCGAADVAAHEPAPEYLAAFDRIWADTAGAKMYITGGIGSSSSNEGFTQAYDLPNETAYAETCASIAMVFWNHRLNLLHADAKYADVVERALYNGVLSGISLSGERFFYTNPLASRGNHHRQPWYTCACCPSNIVRFLPSIGGYVYAHADDTIYVNLYVAGEGRIRLAEGKIVTVRQETRYPWDGRVRLTIDCRADTEITLALRIPGWSQAATLRINDTPQRPSPNPSLRGRGVSLRDPPQRRGYALVRRAWQPGDVVELDLPMPVERVTADPRVQADRGRVALQRGPIVYCLEQADNPAGVYSVALPHNAELTTEHRQNLLDGVTVVKTRASLVGNVAGGWDADLYRRAPAVKPVEITAIPYYAWDNRAAGEMVVWLPESPTLVEPGPVGWITASASHCYRNDTVAALHDRLEPAASDDHGIPRFTWWPKRGDVQWVQYDFDRPRQVGGVEVYWLDDSTRRDGCRPPASWKLLARVDGDWREVGSPSGYGVERDRYNVVTFEAIEADGLRIEAQLEEDCSAGILEWKVHSPE